MQKARLLRAIFRRSPLYRTSLYYRLASAYDWYLDRNAVERWQAGGRRSVPPKSVKRATVKAIAHERGLRTLVETGTAMGEMVFAMRREFDQIYSIEIEPTLFEDAKQRLRKEENVTLFLGDSASVLPNIIAKLSGPALFWLDGHYSGAQTGRGSVDTPVREELKVVLGDSRARHVVLVDDAHCFTGANDYPTIDELTTLAKQYRPSAEITVADNVIRIV